MFVKYIQLTVIVYIVMTCVFAGVLQGSEAMDSAPAMGDAQARWDEQSSSVYAPKHGGPYLSGIYIWGGRADRAYKPFQQWELRIQAGAKGAAGLRIQITPLDAEMNVQHLFREKAAPWQDVNGLGAEGEVILSYKLNCSKIHAYDIILKWDGGEQVYFAGNPFMLPIDKSALKHQAFLVTSNPDFSYKRSRKRAQVSFYISNLGGAAAEEVENTIVFVDQDGTEVHSVIYQPNEGRIEAGYRGTQKAEFQKVPNFYNVLIKTRQSESLTYSWEGDGSVLSEDILLRKLHFVAQVKANESEEKPTKKGKESSKERKERKKRERKERRDAKKNKKGSKQKQEAQDPENEQGAKIEGTLTGVIVNGFPEDITNLLMTITFENAQGEQVKTVQITVEKIESGKEYIFSQKMDTFAYTAYAMSYSIGG